MSDPTPEQRAESFMARGRDCPHNTGLGDDEPLEVEHCEECIADLIRAAVEAERERCIQVVREDCGCEQLEHEPAPTHISYCSRCTRASAAIRHTDET